jgi:hypothetical protein
MIKADPPIRSDPPTKLISFERVPHTMLRKRESGVLNLASNGPEKSVENWMREKLGRIFMRHARLIINVWQ